MQSSRAINPPQQQAWIALWLLRPLLKGFVDEPELSKMETRGQ